MLKGATSQAVIGEGLGWPEGPTLLPDGRIAFVETYRSQISVWSADRGVERLALVGGGPNAVVAAGDGYLYVTQNGGVVGPWRAAERKPPSIQRVSPDGKVEILATEIEGRPLLAPNDLAFGPNGWLYFTDPGGAYDPVAKQNPGFLCALKPDGTGVRLLDLPPTYPNGIVVDSDGSIVWVESYTRAVRRMMPDGTIVDLCHLPAPAVPDGLKIAADGSLYITGVDSGGVEVVARDGAYLGRVPVGRIPTNCLFVGTTLYVTDGGHTGLSTEPEMAGLLWALEMDDISGLAIHDGHIQLK
ncbi:MAG: SMP-30/gluconolactonase/LRE family protein [Bauldia sp.]|nr:SMP-30/gluconolactonase/LRE family protein [Bauldia sp.]